MPVIRYNPDKAGTTDINYSAFNNADDAGQCLGVCYENCGAVGVLTIAVTAIGLCILFGSSESQPSSQEPCFEVCTYDSVGIGICECVAKFFGSA